MKTITLSDIRKPLNIRVQKNMYIGHLQDWIGFTHRYGYSIDYDVYLPSKKMNLQRPLVWTISQKRELIISIIKDAPIPQMTVIIHTDESGEKTFKIIDGKQRLSTMIDFINDKFTLILFDKEYLYSDLPEDIKNVVRMYDIHFDQTYEYYNDLISDEDKINWFRQINFAGTPQEIDHINNLLK